MHKKSQTWNWRGNRNAHIKSKTLRSIFSIVGFLLPLQFQVWDFLCIHARLSYNSFTIYAPASPLFNSLQLLAACVHMMGTGELDTGMHRQEECMFHVVTVYSLQKWVRPGEVMCCFYLLSLTLCDLRDCSPPGSSVHGILKQEYWSCHVILQGIFPTQGSKPGLPHCSWILYIWATRKAREVM